MKKGRALSWFVLLLCIMLVMQFENVISQASRLVNHNYKMTNQVFFNLNNDFEHRVQIITINDAFVIVGRTSVQYISSDGRLIWEKDVSSQNVSVGPGKNGFVLAEKKAGDVFVVDRKGVIESKRFSMGAIESVKMFDDGYIAVLKADNELILLDDKLKTVCSTILPKGVIIDYEIDTSKQYIAIILLDLTRKEFNSKLVLTSFNGNIVSGSNLSEKIVYQMSLHKDEIAVLSDTGLMLFDFNGKLLSETTFDQTIKNFSMGSEIYLHLIGKNNELNLMDVLPERLVKINYRGEIQKELEVKIENANGVKSFGDQLIMFSNDTVIITDQEGKVSETYYGSEQIRNVHIIGRLSFAIEYINHLEIYTLK
ncbi:MAG TPA: hypothetical protein DCS67_05045 [Clostridiales bacterium UBA8960]|nr:hypothetical protein [Clostridiales bacterium UBA8960]